MNDDEVLATHLGGLRHEGKSRIDAQFMAGYQGPAVQQRSGIRKMLSENNLYSSLDKTVTL